MRSTLFRTLTILIVAATISGCALTTRRTSVADLKYNPGRYDDKTVSIEGVVTSSWGVPLMPYKLYKVDDGTGERIPGNTGEGIGTTALERDAQAAERLGRAASGREIRQPAAHDGLALGQGCGEPGANAEKAVRHFGQRIAALPHESF